MFIDNECFSMPHLDTQEHSRYDFPAHLNLNSPNTRQYVWVFNLKRVACTFVVAFEISILYSAS